MPAKTRTQPVSAAAQVRDRRDEKRHPVSFSRPLYITWMQEQSLLGRLIDVSRSGFRVLHQFRRFEPGQEVLVSFPWGKVRAQVIWNRVFRTQVQTGFRLCEDGKRKARTSSRKVARRRER
jgi:hypothetical protein